MLLLDTHALIWWLANDAHLSEPARNAIRTRDTTIVVSAATVWEITTKHRIGKLPGVAALVDQLDEVVIAEGFTPLPVSLPHARRAGLLPGPHRDPFDRMLIAQALAEDLRLVSNEILFESYGVRRLW